MNVRYTHTERAGTEAIIELYKSSGLRRPVDDSERISKMYAHSNLVVCAYEGELLVGIARSLTDFCYACYLSDLAVRKEYQHQGIGKALIQRTQEIIGDQTMLLLRAAPEAMNYYPKLGFAEVHDGFIIPRKY